MDRLSEPRNKKTKKDVKYQERPRDESRSRDMLMTFGYEGSISRRIDRVGTHLEPVE